MGETSAALTFVLALAAGVLSQSLARHLRLPGIVVLLFVGVALGPDGLGWVLPRSLGGGFLSLIDLAVAIILFDGGLNLQISRLRREQSAIQRLVTFGALGTLAGGALCAHYIMGWGWEHSVLFGSLVVVTGPTVIGPLVHELRLRARVATVLEAEGVLIDPVGAILAVLVLELVLTPEHAASGALDLVIRIGFGAAMGIGIGLLLARVLRIRHLVPDGHENVLVLAIVLLLFQLCELVVSHSGILAVTLAGVAVGNSATPVDRNLREFKEELTVMLIGMLFVLLAADVRLSDVQALGLPGLLTVAALIFVVRPLVVAVATAGSEQLNRRDRAFISWIAPRGIVAAAVASLVGSAMEQQGLAGGSELRALVFLTIAVTVVQAGLTAAPVGRLLGVRLPGREGVAVLGVHALALMLAGELRRWGQRVVFLDANPQNARMASEAGFTVVFGNAIEERTLQRARLETMEAAVALTPNQTVNGVFASRARDLFGVPHGYVSVQALDTGMVRELVRAEQVQVLFDHAHDVERWDVRIRHGGVELGHFRYAGVEAPPEGEEPPAAPVIGERLILLAYRRGDRVAPVSMAYEPKEGDLVAVALHIPEMDDALQVMAELGYERVEIAEEGAEGEDAEPEAQAS